PGNHDPGRRALPQPAIPAKYNPGLWGRKNFYMIGNPAVISLNGVKVLIFHGQSVDDIVRTTPGLSYDNPAKVMQALLKARHLSPIYGAQTPLAPELEDLMVIDEVPDIFHAGHVHVMGFDLYRGVLILNSGAWQSQTPFQAGVGVTPTSGLAVLVNLKTFKVYTKDFTEG
ncbi:MAG TPA: DNA polymerase II small subunit, partial [Candidatus Nitrosotenuis sp.]|nr:DNA polymerase II small subunit [Candidatus Nitrosotenuis sp.]